MSNISEEKQIDIILNEKNELRNEIILFQQSMQKSIFALLTILVFALGILSDKDIIGNASARVWVLVALTQFAFIFLLFIISLFSLQNIHGGYIAKLEENITNIAGHRLSLWQSKVADKYMFSKSSSFYLTVLTLSIFILIVLIGLYYFTFIEALNILKHPYQISIRVFIGVLFTAEILVSVFLMYKAAYESSKTKKFIEESKLFQKTDEQKDH